MGGAWSAVQMDLALMTLRLHSRSDSESRFSVLITAQTTGANCYRDDVWCLVQELPEQTDEDTEWSCGLTVTEATEAWEPISANADPRGVWGLLGRL